MIRQQDAVGADAEVAVANPADLRRRQGKGRFAGVHQIVIAQCLVFHEVHGRGPSPVESSDYTRGPVCSVPWLSSASSTRWPRITSQQARMKGAVKAGRPTSAKQAAAAPPGGCRTVAPGAAEAQRQGDPGQRAVQPEQSGLSGGGRQAEQRRDGQGACGAEQRPERGATIRQQQAEGDGQAGERFTEEDHLAEALRRRVQQRFTVPQDRQAVAAAGAKPRALPRATDTQPSSTKAEV